MPDKPDDNATLTRFPHEGGNQGQIPQQTSPSPSAGPATPPAAPIPPIDEDIACPDCGYNLRGLTGIRCPECGMDIAFIRQPESSIPWVHHRKLGRIPAYWKTVWMVMFQNKRFSLEVCRPVNVEAARQFRWVTLVLAYAPVLVLSMFVRAWSMTGQDTTPFLGDWLVFLISQISLFACLFGIITAPYYAIRHKDMGLLQQHRTAVLSQYATASFAWTFAAVALGLTTVLLGHTSSEYVTLLFILLTFGAVIIIAAATIMDVSRLLSRTVHPAKSLRRVQAKFLAVWLLVISVSLVGIPGTILYLLLVFESL